MSEPSAPSSSPLSPEGYGQLCALALALDSLGDRWTLLVLRDLARSPLRFSDLEATNPGISPNLLTKRLRKLEEATLIERRQLASPARGTVYALVEETRELVIPILIGLAGLGTALIDRQMMAGAQPDDYVGPLIASMRQNGHWVLARGSRLSGYFVLDVSGIAVHITMMPHEFIVEEEPPGDRTPDATISIFPPTALMRVMGRVLDLDEAEATGQISIAGDQAAGRELITLLTFAESEGGPD